MYFAAALSMRLNSADSSLFDEVPANGETWFLGRCFELLRHENLVGVVSFSDPVPRTSLLLPDGSVLNARTVQKIRGMDRGWKYADGLTGKLWR
jgi:hypothetical protein